MEGSGLLARAGRREARLATRGSDEGVHVPGAARDGVLTLDLENFVVEFEDGSLKTVGPPDAGAAVTLYHLEDVEAREFGGERVKIAAEDGEGNAVEVALGPADLRALRADLRNLDLDDEWPAFE